ncbi:hypothetical protein BSLG_000411 [Batrachochytrium salamandrivorans]|nr:hypothetical protein BSLG_000411 [Batrachochytrium salamandrivorans]
MATPTSVLVLGATGMTGRKLVGELLQSPLISKVQLVGRRNCNADERKDWPNQDKLVESIVNMDHLDARFCCLGTTRADAGSAEAFVRIDKDIPLQAATLLKEAGGDSPQHFVLLTSAGSNAESWFLYPKTKGQLEQGVSALGFSTLAIMRPGLIDYRPDNRPKHRAVEQWAAPLLGFIAPRSSLCGISQLGHAMRRVAETWLTQGPASHAHPIVKIYENDAILDLAESK